MRGSGPLALFWRIFPWLIALALAILLAATLRLPLEAMFVRYPLNYNEGWNAIHTLRLRSGGPLYPAVSEGTFINYPPLSFYVVAALHPLFGDDIFAGRAVALAAELAVSLNVALAARALRTGWTVAMLTALTFLAFC
ncbi:MAG TPA: hypothetical protein VHA07_13380, partial [Devosia sp.]|nr:hypothetical protein [Devosia sp.]